MGNEEQKPTGKLPTTKSDLNILRVDGARGKGSGAEYGNRRLIDCNGGEESPHALWTCLTAPSTETNGEE